MKILLEQIIRLRNPHFRFDESVTSRLLLAFAWSYGRSYLRGLRLLLLAKMPRHVPLGRGVGFFNSPNIRLGRWVKLGDHVQLSAAGTGELVIGDHSGIGAFSRVVIATSFNQLGSHIRIGKNVGIGEFAYLGGGGGLRSATIASSDSISVVTRKIISPLTPIGRFACKALHAKAFASARIAGSAPRSPYWTV